MVNENANNTITRVIDLKKIKSSEIDRLIEGLDEDIRIIESAFKRIEQRIEGSGIEYLPMEYIRYSLNEEVLRLFFIQTPFFRLCSDGYQHYNRPVSSAEVKLFLQDPEAWHAKASGVDLETYRRYLRYADERGCGYVYAGCNYKGCNDRRGIYFENPKEFVLAQECAAYMLWYCHNHRGIVWEQDGVLGDDIVEVLYRIYNNPGCSKTEALNKRISSSKVIEFLEDIGLIEAGGERRNTNGRFGAYKISLTLAGESYLKKLQHEKTL